MFVEIRHTAWRKIRARNLRGRKLRAHLRGGSLTSLSRENALEGRPSFFSRFPYFLVKTRRISPILKKLSSLDSLRFPPRGDFEANRLSQSLRAQPTLPNEAIPFERVMALRKLDKQIFKTKNSLM